MEWLPRVGVEERIVVVVVVVENGERRVYSDSWLFLFSEFSHSDPVAVLLTLIPQHACFVSKMYLVGCRHSIPLHYNFPTIVAVYSFVEELPPRSPVIVFPSAIVYNTSDGVNKYSSTYDQRKININIQRGQPSRFCLHVH